MYTCKVCGKEVPSKGALGAHMGNYHRKNEVQTCKICGMTFTNGGLRGHMNIHRTEKAALTPQTCKICGKSFGCGGALGGHMSISHPKNGVQHPGAAKLSKVWEGLSDEDHLARAQMTRDSRFKGNDDIALTKIQEQMILGSLLGDMCIWRQHKGITGISNPELRISHSSKQRDYVMWKYDILKNIARKEPYEIIQKTGFGAGFSAVRFETKSLSCLNPIYDVVMGEENEKHITQEWLDMITDPIAIATWFMDDGSLGRTGRGCQWFALGLSTDNEVDLIQSWLNDVWSLKTSYTRSTGTYNDNTYAILSILAVSRNEFNRIIIPHIIPSMKYKVDLLIKYVDCICK